MKTFTYVKADMLSYLEGAVAEKKRGAMALAMTSVEKSGLVHG